MAERYRLLELSVNENTSPEAAGDARAIARWIGQAFGDMSQLRANMEAEHEKQRANRELAKSLSRGDANPGGTDYMEPDSEHFTQHGEVES